MSTIEFLATDTSDPRREFITSLCSALGKSGSIVVYSAFESQRLSELAAWLPEFAGRIKKIQRRLWDLLPVVRNHVYHPKFAGSYSIKNVLPALVPGMTYEGMAGRGRAGRRAGVGIARHGEAWISPSATGSGRRLLDYCGQDTLAMVKLLEKLKSPKESY